MFKIDFEYQSLNDKLDIMNLTVQTPKNFEKNLIVLKHEYIKSRRQMGDEQVSFEKKIIRLASLALKIDPLSNYQLVEYYAWTILNLKEL